MGRPYRSYCVWGVEACESVLATLPPGCMMGSDPSGLSGLGGYLGYLPAVDAPPRLRVGVTVRGSGQG